MERVVCISHAKVPIVKIWDPELRLACDMNVNNTLALENTRMVRTYVDIDERVRPLAMMIKHWTKRRILNDAGMSPPIPPPPFFLVTVYWMENVLYIFLASFRSGWHVKLVYVDLLDHQLLSNP